MTKPSSSSKSSNPKIKSRSRCGCGCPTSRRDVGNGPGFLSPALYLETPPKPNTSNPRSATVEQKVEHDHEDEFPGCISDPRIASLRRSTANPIRPHSRAHPLRAKVFLANGGADLNSVKQFQGGDPTNEPYNSTYAALQTWGHWQLVSSPGDADLVLVVRSIAPPNFYTGGMPQGYSPQIELKIYDAKSHFLLWAFTQPIHGALLQSTADKNYAAAIQGLIIQLKLLTTPATP